VAEVVGELPLYELEEFFFWMHMIKMQKAETQSPATPG
jgi:hypothetical protein